MSRKRYFVTALLSLLLAVLPLIGIAFQPASVSAAETEGKTVVLDNCDSSLAFKGTSNLNVDTTNYITGTGSILSVNTLGTINAVFRNVDHASLPAFEDAYLEMYLYIGNVDNIATEGGALELTSSGVNDMDEISMAFTPTKIGMKTGWNYISLRLADFAASSANPGGSFDYNNICGMRIFAFPKDYSELLEIGVDEIIITDAPRIDTVREEGIEVKHSPHSSIEYKVRDDVAGMVTDGNPSVAAIVVGCIGGAVFVASVAYIVIITVKKRGKTNRESK